MEKEKEWISLELLRQVPIMVTEVSKLENICEYHDNLYNGAVVRNTVLEDFYVYVKQLEDAGFAKSFEEDLTNGLVSIAVFRKDDLLLNVHYIEPQHSTYIYVTKNRRDYLIQPEKLFEDVLIDGEMQDCGAGNYVIRKEQIEKSEYEALLSAMSLHGFETCYQDEKGIEGFVFHSIFKKKNKVISITYMRKTKVMTITAGYDLPLSEHLVYKKEYENGNEKQCKTRLHMLELYYFGNCFILQLKNNHFLLFDVGPNWGHEYLFDYLDMLCPHGTKPVIEAIFISHAHGDHIGALRALLKEPQYGERVYVEEIYYNEPNEAAVAMDSLAGADITWLKESLKYLSTTSGEQPKMYRPYTGQKYYYNDVEIDVICSQEQIPIKDYSGEFNDSSTWFLLRIEGQKCLLGGDGDKGGMYFIMRTYDKEFMQTEVASLLHHGWNTRDLFTEFCVPKTMLVTTHSDLPKLRCKENERLKMLVEEWLPWGDGTKVLTFPYHVGEYEKLSNFEWIYHKGKERPSMHY